jgi:CRP-like cAMP-binding protein
MDAYLEEARLPVGATVVTANRPSRYLYVIAAGEAAVKRGVEDLQTLGPGALIGGPAGANTPAGTSVVARTPLHLIVLDGAILESYVATDAGRLAR